MPSGGARARSGPPPDPNALARERDAGEWVELPLSGRQGPPPPWPMVDPSERELGIWAMMWRKPQAFMWQKLGQENEVALYVRRFVEAEKPGSSLQASMIVRQLNDSLGISTPGLRSNRWKIVDDSPQESAKRDDPKRTSARNRFKVVDADQGA